MSVATGEPPEAIEDRYDGQGYGQFKTRRGRGGRRVPRAGAARYEESARDPAELERLLAVGAEKARAASAPTLEAMYERMGFVRPLRQSALIAATVVHDRAAGRSPLRDRRAGRSPSSSPRSRWRASPGWSGSAPSRSARASARRVTGVLQSTLGNLPGALHRPLRALGRRDRRRADLDPRLAVRERPARPRPRDRRGRESGRQTAACASARVCRTTRPSCCCSRLHRSSSSGSRTGSATVRATIWSRSRLIGAIACSSSTAHGCGVPAERAPARAAHRAAARTPCRSGRRSRCSRVAGVGAAFVSDWFVSALDPAVEASGSRRRSPVS